MFISKKQIIKKVLSSSLMMVFLLLSTLFAETTQAASATLYFSPATGTYIVGQSFSLGVFVSSSESVNAVSGTIDYPSDRLEVTGLSKNNSVVSFWVQEPSYSNASGTVNFEGVILNPGYQGTAGRIITLTFKVKPGGGAMQVRFTSGSVLANDGKGTNIISGLGSAAYDVSSTQQQPVQTEPKPEKVSGLPSAPEVASNTHPDSSKWYANSEPNFSWRNPSGVTGVNILGDQKPDTDPGTKSDGLFETYKYTNVGDGTWYFHIRFKNAAGWGPVSHFRFNIDKTKPTSLEISEVEGAPVNTARLKLSAQDLGSGIDHYEINIDGKDYGSWADDGQGYYQTEELVTSSSRHSLSLRAVDGAGNYTEKVQEFSSNLTTSLPKVKSKSNISLSRLNLLGDDLGYLILAVIALMSVGISRRRIHRFFGGLFGRSRADKQQKGPSQVVAILEKAKTQRALTSKELAILASFKDGNAVSDDIPSVYEAKVVEGVFDGQNVFSSDGQKYSVPANYASKTKLVEGDILKVKILPDGELIFKLIAPTQRYKAEGVVEEFNRDDFRVIAGDKQYKILLASVYYFKTKSGDKVSIVLPKDHDARWAAIEDVIERYEKQVSSKPAKASKKTRTKK